MRDTTVKFCSECEGEGGYHLEECSKYQCEHRWVEKGVISQNGGKVMMDGSIVPAYLNLYQCYLCKEVKLE